MKPLVDRVSYYGFIEVEIELLRTAQAADIASIRALLVHAKDDAARWWYLNWEFEPSASDPFHLFFLMAYCRGDIAYVLTAYNAGERRVDRHRDVPSIPETQAYVRKVMGLYGVTRHSFDEKLTGAPPWLGEQPR